MGGRLSEAAWRKVFQDRPRGRGYWHLEKASNSGVCHCECERSLVAAPDQLDCPWCGCGWLFSCCRCGRSFTYAKPVRLTTPVSEIVEMDFRGRGYPTLKAAFFRSVSRWMREALASVEPEKEYVYFDGYFVPLDVRRVTIDGRHGSHRVVTLPHARELKSPGALERALGRPAYWHRVRHPDPASDAG